MTGRELYELFETRAKIIIRLISEVETFPPIKQEGELATIQKMEICNDTITINIDGNEFGNKIISKIYCGTDTEINGFEVVSNTKLIYEYKNSNSELSYQDWLNNRTFQSDYETLTLELDLETYNKLFKLASENNTTIETIVNNLLELCVKEDGLVVWKNGFNNPYTVLKTKEEVQEWINHEN